MSKRFFKPVRKDLEWGPELLKDTPRFSSSGSCNSPVAIDAVADAVALITINAAPQPGKQPAALSVYNAKISEFTKELAATRPDLLPKDRVVVARDMYKQWKSAQ